MTTRSPTVRIPCPPDTGPERPSLDLAGASEFHIGRTIIAGGLGAYEPEVFAVLCALIDECDGPVTFLDIGANIGIFSLVVKAIFGSKVRVSAFEPLPALATFVLGAAQRNRLELDVREVALSHKEERARFYVSAKSDTSNSLNSRFRGHKEVIDVDVRRLDGLYPESTVGNFLLKIDTESTEPDVLEGGAKFIARNRPAIVCEVLAGRTEDRLASFFGRLEYVPIHITGAPRWEGARELKGDEKYEYRDWLFLPAPASARLTSRFAAWHAAFVGGG